MKIDYYIRHNKKIWYIWIKNINLSEFSQWLKQNEIEFNQAKTDIPNYTILLIHNENDLPLISLRWL